mmetsp:Transcript_37128/g.77738  ORF Transcript_37128/g.77738 Transcript_37128/m.77738 type:complete len:90 (+) Transcript_37128:104-373(+)
MKHTTAIALSTGGVIGALVAIMASTGYAFVVVPAVPHQEVNPSSIAGQQSKANNNIRMMMGGNFAVLDNPLVEKDESIVAARKCAVCIG